MTQHDFLDLVTELGKMVGLPQLKPDSDGRLSLAFDAMVLHLQPDRHEDAVVIYCLIGEVRDTHQPEIYKHLLEANALWNGTGGGTLGALDHGKTAILAQLVPYNPGSFYAFEKKLESFINLAETWQRRLERLAQSSSTMTREPFSPKEMIRA